MEHNGKGNIVECATWPALRWVTEWPGFPQVEAFGGYLVKYANVRSTKFVKPGDYCRIA